MLHTNMNTNNTLSTSQRKKKKVRKYIYISAMI